MVHTATAIRILAAILPFLVIVGSLPTPEDPTSVTPQGPPYYDNYRDGTAPFPTTTPHHDGGNHNHHPNPKKEQQQQQQQQPTSPGEPRETTKTKTRTKKLGSSGAPESPPSGTPPAPGTNPAPKNAKAIYFITNDPTSNAIVPLKVAADGTLSPGSITPTGGKGGIGIQMGKPAAVDPLFSQSAVRVGAGMIMAVNAGSNTLSLFTIDPEDPTKLTMAGTPVDTMGEFPVSVAFSDKLMQACVANTGAKSGISCFSATPQGLTPLQPSQRPLALNQTTPPTGPEGTISHALFTADSSALLATVKGNPATNTTGFIAAYPVQNGTVGAAASRSSPPGTAVLFGAANIDPRTVLATDASFGAALLTLAPDLAVRTKARTPIAGQKATCWAALSPLTRTVFVTDVGANRVVELDAASGAVVGVLELRNGNPGMIDVVAVGGFVYALAPKGRGGVRVVVVDVSRGRGTGREVQGFLVEGEGVGAGSMGMTFV